jgi:hypothetical protein
LFVSWELTVEQQRDFIAASGRHPMFVRVHLDHAAGPIVNESAVLPDSRYWFISVSKPGAGYCAELGYYLPEHDWICLASSGLVRTPVDTASEDRTAHFAELPQPAAFSFGRPATGEEPKLRASAPAPFVMSETVPPRQQHDLFPGNWTVTQERALEELIGLVVTRHEWFDSLQLIEMLQKRLAGAEFWKSELAGQQPGPSSGEFLPSAQEQETPSSPSGEQVPQAKRGFWFNVNAELIIYGATEPTARVTIGGRPIQLRADGTFSYRFALPDGQFELPTAAVSVDEDTRRAELRFSRRTDYHGEVGAHPQSKELRIPAAENVV